MTTFQTVNVGLGLTENPPEATTPTTPRAPIPTPARPAPAAPVEDPSQSVSNTPTTVNFGGVNGQRPLPSSPFSNALSSPHQSINDASPELLTRGDSHRSIHSTGSQDVDMDDSDGDDMGSDTESIDADGRPSKKKKGQRFFCTEFPPCKLSFTRSEHLARHIRKHTGERPFQCHCSRRFSRLDNLRQHAQTVHINEEIPQDSLAATGTRFQRQIRTDRVARPTSGRSRASTAGSQSGHVRGHSRNLSTSSIGSTASTISRDDGRRRPPPLMMANDHSGRARLSLDVLRSGASTPPGQGSFYRESSEGINTPISTTFSTGQNSPGYGSSLGSPVSAVSRGGFWDGRSHARRLSVPSGPVPFQSPQHISYGSPYLSPLASSKASTFSNFSSSLGSPSNITHTLSRVNAVSSAAEAEWRRRTWHPSTYTHTNYSRPATSGLSYYQTPDAPRPAFAPQAAAAASQPHRLPGIESFDPVLRRPATPPARGPSPMKIDTAVRPPIYPGPAAYASSGPNDRRGHASWDMSLHQNLTKLDLASGTPPRDQGPWNQHASSNPRPYGEQSNQAFHGPPVVIHQESQKRAAENPHYPTTHSNRAKRQGWYAGPPPGGQQSTSQPRTSPEGSSSSEGVPTTPSFTSSEHHPAIMHSNGYVESARPAIAAGTSYNYSSGSSHPPAWPLPAEPTNAPHNISKDTEMSGLEVLVAVATREENATVTPNA